jgi:hypothetical protein
VRLRARPHLLHEYLKRGGHAKDNCTLNLSLGDVGIDDGAGCARDASKFGSSIRGSTSPCLRRPCDCEESERFAAAAELDHRACQRQPSEKGHVDNLLAIRSIH